MGLSTASVRHPHVMVMAPALTKASQSQNFKLPPSSPVQSLQNRDEHSIYSPCEKSTDLENGVDNLNTLALVSELLKNNCVNLMVDEESSGNPSESSDIMNSSPIHMGDHKDKMGLQKAGLDIVTSLIKDKTTNNDVDQLFNNIDTVLPGADIGQNVDDLMQVIKSMETGSDRLGGSTSDLGGEADAMFPLSGTDLTSNLSSFEKELFNDVDVMSMSMEDLDGANTIKENHAKELLADLQRKHSKLERRLEFILRRLRKMQIKEMGQHISEEVAGIFEHIHRILRRSKDNNTEMQNQDEKYRPISPTTAKSLIRKLELSSTLQTNTVGRQRHLARYFGSSSVEQNSLRNALVGSTTIPSWSSETKQDLQRVTGLLYSETRLVQEDLDSEATLSSSGGESCDEMQTYSNLHQQTLTIQKRAAWKYATERASIAARWTWLQVQILDLEHRIRQYNEFHKQIRTSKGCVILGGRNPSESIPNSPTTINGYRGLLPGASPLSSKCIDSTANGAVNGPDFQCSRTRPLINFRKRKLRQTCGLHVFSKKAARSSTIRCGCVPPITECALCTGRTDPTRPRDVTDYLSKSERIALLDPGFHPAFSLIEDVSTSTHLEGIMKTTEWQQKSTRPNIKSAKFLSKSDRLEKSLIDQPKKQQPEQRRKYSRLIKSSTISALSAKLRSKMRGRKPGLHSLTRLRRKRHSEKSLSHLQSSSALESMNDEMDHLGSCSVPYRLESRSSSPLLSMQSISNYKRNSRVSSYDIDNIVIPYSVAAATRVEKLQYKEILTPKWRIVDPDFGSKYSIKNNGLVKESEQESDTEDVTEEAVTIRHDKCEHDERKKFLSYLKFPYGYGRSRSHKRTDSRAESSGCNTPDPMSPHPGDTENTVSPMTSPPATPLSMNMDDSSTLSTLPSASMLRKRTMSQSRFKDKDMIREEVRPNSPESIEVPPYDRRIFPLGEEVYDKMLKLMPENHQFKTNIMSQDYASPVSYLNTRAESPDSESTESAIGDEDPNDPEWLDMENTKERYRR